MNLNFLILLIAIERRLILPDFEQRPDRILTLQLKRSGNASRFVELLLAAHEEKRLIDPREILEGLSE